VLKNRTGVRTPDYVEDMAHDLLVIPAGGELGLAWLADSVPVAATTARFTVEYVGGPLRAGVNVPRLRPVLGINRIPSRTIRVSRPIVTVRGNAKRLVVLLVAARLNGLGPHRGNVATRLASGNFPLRPGEIVVRPV
jgi:hypothetical protein